ncbi:MAG: sigma-54-dependent Fis family transcriptional regulator [Verrucomicrobia bacterium]|nr:sigma-54-dependent Fis family transcriptional regulator [Verrucomicrobiota bacterium]
MTKLLIVDDNPRDQERYRHFLAGYDLTVVGDGGQALAGIMEASPMISMAVVLWELRGALSGAEFLIRLGRLSPKTRVIVVSGLLDISRAATAKALGAFDFLLKPLEKERLCLSVESALCDSSAESDLLPELRKRMIGSSPSFMSALRALARVIPQKEITILLGGETGTGKELFARSIHELGTQKSEPLVPVNIAAIPSTLVESALFGHEKGAFTDARERRIGAFEESGAGTLFLDEIGELDLPVQAKLLRVIQERTFRRLGGSHDLKFRARLICATNRDLTIEIKSGRFREDLYHRIADYELRIPSVKDRDNDLWLLIDSFLVKYGHERRITLARETRELLSSYPFHGNVRELENIIRRAILECDDDQILTKHLPLEVMSERQAADDNDSRKEQLCWPVHLFNLPQKEAVEAIEIAFDQEYLPKKLRESRGNVTQAAKTAGLDPKTFRKKWEAARLEPLSMKGSSIP